MTRKTFKNKETPISRARRGDDVALLCGATKDGKGLNVLRRRGDALEAGVVRPLEEGRAIHGEVVQLRQRGDTPVCDVEVLYAAAEGAEAEQTGADVGAVGAERAGVEAPKLANAAALSDLPADSELGGPPQVASDAYRRNWDAIWKTSRTSKKLVN